MLSLKQNCEVFVLRNDVSIGEWTECCQGSKLAVQKNLFLTSKVEENRCCGDMSRVVATFRITSEAFNCTSFGKFAAMCGDCEMMHTFLQLQQHKNKNKNKKRKKNDSDDSDDDSDDDDDDKDETVGCIYETLLLSIIEGAITSGDFKCLDKCLDLWTNASRVWSLTDFVAKYDFQSVSASTLEWISSKWSDDAVLTFIDSIPPAILFVNRRLLSPLAPKEPGDDNGQLWNSRKPKRFSVDGENGN